MNEQEFRYREIKGQSRRGSFAESLVNVAIGYGIAVGAQIAIFPMFGIIVPLHDNLAIGAIFTVISIVRSYTLRRAFNWWHYRPIKRALVPMHDGAKISSIKVSGPVKRGDIVGRPAIHKANPAGEWRDGVFIKGK